MKNHFCYSKPLCSSFTHRIKWKHHFFLYALLWFTFPNSENISWAAGIKSNFLVYSPMMAEPGMTPEETCVHDLLRHRPPLRVRLSVLCFHTDTAVSAPVTHTVGTDVGAHKMCARTTAEFQQLQGELPISLWLAQPCLSAGHRWHMQVWDTPDPTAPRTCLSSGCLWMPLQCQALLWDLICGVKDWLPLVTQPPHYLYGCSAPAALLATAHNVPLRRSSPGTQ